MSNNTSASAAEQTSTPKKASPTLRYVPYGVEKESPFLPAIKQLISKDLSEPYSIYVYRYFLYQWGHLCFMVGRASVRTAFPLCTADALKALNDQDSLIGVIVCKLEPHRGGPMRGYIAMLATREDYRGHGIATSLVKMAIEKMKAEDADEIALETEVDNIPSLRIYENLGFIRTKRLHRYYLNGNTAFRLILYLKPGVSQKPTYPPDFGMPISDPAAVQGNGLMEEDLYARQAAQQAANVQIQDVYGEKFDISKAAKSDDF